MTTSERTFKIFVEQTAEGPGAERTVRRFCAGRQTTFAEFKDVLARQVLGPGRVVVSYEDIDHDTVQVTSEIEWAEAIRQHDDRVLSDSEYKYKSAVPFTIQFTAGAAEPSDDAPVAPTTVDPVDPTPKVEAKPTSAKDIAPLKIITTIVSDDGGEEVHTTEWPSFDTRDLPTLDLLSTLFGVDAIDAVLSPTRDFNFGSLLRRSYCSNEIHIDLFRERICNFANSHAEALLGKGGDGDLQCAMEVLKEALSVFPGNAKLQYTMDSAIRMSAPATSAISEDPVPPTTTVNPTASLHVDPETVDYVIVDDITSIGLNIQNGLHRPTNCELLLEVFPCLSMESAQRALDLSGNDVYAAANYLMDNQTAQCTLA